MNLENDRELANTERKLRLLDRQIESAKSRPRSPENDQSIHSLAQMANQMREEIARYRARHKRPAPQPLRR
jgi:hypothetical protein